MLTRVYPEATYASHYSERELRDWAKKIRRWLKQRREVQAYFDNDAFGATPLNAMRLLELRAQRLNSAAPRRR